MKKNSVGYKFYIDYCTMAFLQSLNNENDVDFSKDVWYTESGPYGISGFNCDGKEVGNYCFLCDAFLDSPSLVQSHFLGKRHSSKLRQFRSAKNRLVIESSTGNADDPDNLFLPGYCRVCDAELAQEDQAESHYMSEKHQKKVRHYFLVKVGVKENHPAKALVDPEEKKKELEGLGKMEYCPLCECEFSAPVVARTHYVGKRHAKKLKEKAEFDALEQNNVDWTKCDPCDAKFETRQDYLLHVITVKHKTNVQKDLTSDDKVKLLAKRREQIENQMSEEAVRRKLLQSELKSIDSELGKM